MEPRVEYIRFMSGFENGETEDRFQRFFNINLVQKDKMHLLMGLVLVSVWFALVRPLSFFQQSRSRTMSRQ
jgi:hypothetical protein